MNGALAALVIGDGQDAVRRFRELANEEPYSIDEDEKHLASFFVEASKRLTIPDKPISGSITRQYSNKNFEAFGLLCFGVHDWAIGDAANASAIFKTFLAATLPRDESWIDELNPMAAEYASDCARVAEIQKDLVAVRNPESAQALVEKVRAARDELKFGGKLATRLKSIEAELIAKGAHP